MIANPQQTDTVQQFLAYEKCYKITGGYQNCVAAHEPLSYTDKYPLTKNSWVGHQRLAHGRDRPRSGREVAQAVAHELAGCGAAAAPPPAASGDATPPVTLHLLPLALLFLVAWTPAEAHDPSAWGGLFRSRDQGARWLPVNEGRFIGGALGLAVSPADPHHLLLATDSGLLRSRNGGRDWQAEAPAVLVGGVYAAAFDRDGTRALASTAQGLYRTDDGVSWRRLPIPKSALPARAIAAGAAGRAYVAGADGFWQSDDEGASWAAQSDGLPGGPVTALLVGAPSEPILLVSGGRLWRRSPDGRAWEPSDAGMPEGRVDTAARDPGDPGRVWAAAADQLYRSADGGRSWTPAGAPLPEPNTSVRGIAVSGPAIALTTHRGLYRSGDGGKTWELLEGMLPVHLEAGPLARDPVDPHTLYAGFAITPYDEMWRMADHGGTMLGRLDALSLAGGAAFLLVMALAAAAALRALGRHYGARAHAAGGERAR